MKVICLGWVVVLCFMLILSGCGSSLNAIMEGLGKNDCQTKVSKDRKVLLFARNHIYVGGKPREVAREKGAETVIEMVWDPEAYTKHRYGGAPWKNSSLVKHRAAQIKSFFKQANKIFEDNGLNISIHNSGYEVIVDEKMVYADAGWLGALGHNLQVVLDTAKKDPGNMHVHWCWTNSQAYIGVGFRGYVVVCDDPKLGSKMQADDFAHELVHSLGYEEHGQPPDNLMSEPISGTKLTSEQIQKIWSYVNSDKNLVYLSCKR